MKKFNTTAVCIPTKHYMVDISDKVEQIRKLVDEGKYFTINRARQYGKTTTLKALKQLLMGRYSVLSLSFEGITNANFETEESFVKAFCRLFKKDSVLYKSIPQIIKEQLEDYIWRKGDMVTLDELFITLQEWCSITDKPLVMFIDEVDSATNNQIFIDFLASLRAAFIARESEDIPAFQSVILAGVTDVKHLKAKIRPEDAKKVNSPWNIAADFDVDMSLSEAGIKGMLDEYEADHNTGMDTAAIARSVREYTNGYPYLVSRICELIDTKLVPDTFNSLSEAWTGYGVDEAVKKILSEESPLFESLTGKLVNYPELKGQLRRILLRGETIAHLPDDEEQKQLRMYGFITNDHNTVAVANRIFEMRLYNYFIGESSKNDDLRQLAAANKNIFVDDDGWLDISKIMAHFIKEHNIIHQDETVKFLEQEVRERFLTYLAPIINGTGTYSIEEQTRDHRRMDVVVHYLGRRYIIELKIWHGDRYNADGEKQISEYLDRFGLTTGYMLSFNFNKNKEPGVKRVQVGDRILFEGMV